MLEGEEKKKFREEIRRAEDPLSDYKGGGRKLYDVWPDFFPRRAGLPKSGTIKQRTYRRMLKYSDGRFAASPPFIFVNANVKSVLSVNSNVGLRCRLYPNVLERFKECITAPAFRSTILDALRDPGSKAARVVYETASKFIRFVARDVSHSAAQKDHLQVTLYADQRTFGTSTLFDTHTLNDVHDPTALRLWKFPDLSDEEFEAMMSHVRSHDKERQKEYGVDEGALQDGAAANAVACGVAWEQFRQNCQNTLYALPASRRVDGPQIERPKGVFGYMSGWRDVVEENERGASHAHISARGGVTPEVLGDVASDNVKIFLPELGRDGTLEEFAAAAIDSQISCTCRCHITSWPLA